MLRATTRHKNIAFVKLLVFANRLSRLNPGYFPYKLFYIFSWNLNNNLKYTFIALEK